METQDPKELKQSTERKMEMEESRSLTSDYAQSYTHHNSMVLAQRQKYRSMEQHRKPRDKPTQLWSPNL